MPEGTAFTFNQPHDYDSLTNDYYFGQTIPHPSHVVALPATIKNSGVQRPMVMVSKTLNNIK